MKIDLIPIKLFFSLTKTGEHRNTTPITIGIVSECGKFSFYGEFTDFDRGDNMALVQETILPLLKFTKLDDENVEHSGQSTNMTVSGNRQYISAKLQEWIHTIYSEDLVDFWGDSLTYDWLILSELLDSRPSKPLMLKINTDSLTEEQVQRFKEEFLRWQNSNPQPLLIVNAKEDIKVEHSIRISYKPTLPDNVIPNPKDIETLFSFVGLSPQRAYFVGLINQKDMEHDSLYKANIIKKCYFKLINMIGTRG